MSGEVHLISDVRAEDLPQLLTDFRGYWKVCSIVWMRAMGIPVLSGVVLSQWNTLAAAVTKGFCERNHFEQLLVRLEQQGQRWTKRRGGYLIPVAQAGSVVEEIAREGMITILLEPASPYMDHYSLTAVVVPTEGIVEVEIVGPGFDASDTLRGDILPHERYRLELSRNSTLEESRIKRTYLVSGKEYRESVQTRLAKIGAKLENAAYPNQLLQSVSMRVHLANKGKEFLAESRQCLLLENLRTYKPIPRQQLHEYWSWLRRLLDSLSGRSHLGTFAVAAGILEARGLRFWDFYPAGSRDTNILLP